MSVRDELRKGWCPGALRPMETGDGLLLRVKPRAGALSVDALAIVADVAERFGSGDIDLTNRANLQLRGIDRARYEDALLALGEAGLLDAHAESEAVRNIVVEPLSGIDADFPDVRDHAAAIEQTFCTSPALWRMPGKFSVSLTGGRIARLEGRSADIMSFMHEGRAAIALDGDPKGFALVDDGLVARCVTRLAYVFLSLHTNDNSIRRMRDAVALCGSLAIFAAGGLPRLEREPERECHRRPRAGVIAHGDRVVAVGLGLPFGRVSAPDLRALCEAMRALDIFEVRPGTTRVLFVPAGAKKARQLVEFAAGLDLIIRADDVRLAMDVCPGAPACRNGTTATRADAARLARRLQASGCLVPAIHVSGCIKGCARRESAALTFVARDGRYDIVRDGAPDGAACCSGVGPDDLADAADLILAGKSP